METLQMVAFGLTTFLSFCNVCIMLYTFRGFVKKPKDDIIGRIVELEVKVKEHDDSLKKGNDNFREQDKTNEVILTSILALIEFEMQYCAVEKKPVTQGLQTAKENLNKFLTKR